MGLTRGQFVCSEDLVCGSDGELKTCPDRRMVGSGFLSSELMYASRSTKVLTPPARDPGWIWQDSLFISHERRKALRPSSPLEKPLCTISPQERTTRGTPGPSPRRRTLAVSLGLGLKGCRVALSLATISDYQILTKRVPLWKPHPQTRVDRVLLAQSSRLNSANRSPPKAGIRPALPPFMVLGIPWV